MSTPALTRIDHVGIAVHDLDRGIEQYEQLFGLSVLGRETNDEQGVEEAMLRVAGAPGGVSCIQLLRPLQEASPVGRFLAARGEGLHHVAYGVDDITASLQRLRADGARLVDESPRHGFGGSAIAFLHPKGLDGVLTELVQAAAP
jgi:methylmalonyl-CoA/ethylmalonyl-CoA epimerase